MTSPPVAPDPAGRRAPPARRSLLLSVGMLIAGLLLLLPGVCALAFMGTSIGDLRNWVDAVLLWIWGTSFAISAAGVALIVKAFR